MRSSFFVILLLFLIIAGAYFIAGGVSKTPIKPFVPTETPTQVVIDQVSTTGVQSLQIGKLPFSTVTPPPSPTPTNAPMPTGTIDFSSAALDWDDVGDIIAGAQLIGESYPLDTTCSLQLVDAIRSEKGYPPPPPAIGGLPGSRVALCRANPSCKEKGYNSYTGTTPLPQSVPDADCQKKISDAFYTIFNKISDLNPALFAGLGGPDRLMAELRPPIFPNCDATDYICFPGP